MNWQAEIHAEFARRQKTVDETVIEELAQHAAAAFEAARADGQSVADAEAKVRALVEAWCAGTNGPRRLERLPLLPRSPRAAHGSPVSASTSGSASACSIGNRDSPRSQSP